MRKGYQSDLSVAEWAYLKPLLPLQNATGLPKMHSTREILNAVFYIVRGGCCRTSSLQHEDRLPLLPLVALGWDVGEDARRPAQASSPPEEPLAQRRHRRQSVGQDCRRGWRATWLRRGQEGQRQKAASVGRYPGTSARSADPQRESPRPKESIKLLLDIAAWDRLPKRLSHLWLVAGYTGEGKDGLASSPLDGLDMSGI
jgi:hypothetical protein